MQSLSIGVIKSKTSRMKQQTRKAGKLGKSSVLMFVAMLAVPNNGVAEMTEMQSDLMVATGVGFTLNQRQAGRIVSSYGVREGTRL